jgi:hypothetical protein
MDTYQNFDSFVKDYKNVNIIYVTGKGGVGKSILSTIFSDTHSIINLDEIVRKYFYPKYGTDAFKVYQAHQMINIKDQFVDIVRTHMNFEKIIVEGTIKDTELIDSIFNGLDFVMVYVKPITKDLYKRNIVERFHLDLQNGEKTLGFVWDKIKNFKNIKKEFDNQIDNIVDIEFERINQIELLYRNYNYIVVYNNH